jgi:hypothetical protein
MEDLERFSGTKYVVGLYAWEGNHYGAGAHPLRTLLQSGCHPGFDPLPHTSCLDGIQMMLLNLVRVAIVRLVASITHECFHCAVLATAVSPAVADKLTDTCSGSIWFIEHLLFNQAR